MVLMYQKTVPLPHSGQQMEEPPAKILTHEAGSSILTCSVTAQKTMISLLYTSGYQHLNRGSLVGCSVIASVCKSTCTTTTTTTPRSWNFDCFNQIFNLWKQQNSTSISTKSTTTTTTTIIIIIIINKQTQSTD